MSKSKAAGGVSECGVLQEARLHAEKDHGVRGRTGLFRRRRRERRQPRNQRPRRMSPSRGADPPVQAFFPGIERGY